MEKIKEMENILKKIIKVKNFKDVINQFLIEGDDFVLLQSYQSPIVLKYKEKTYLFKNWDYSKTTGKYRNIFLGEDKKTTLTKLKNGEYKAVDFEIN